MKKISAITLASAVAGALALAATPLLAQTKGGTAGMTFHCYGIAKAGQNDCANATKTHSCAGESKVDFELGEWKGTKDAAECQAKGGSATPGKGVNKNVKM